MATNTDAHADSGDQTTNTDDVLENQDPAGDDQDNESLEDVLGSELESLREGESDERTNEQKVADEVTGEDEEPGDNEAKPTGDTDAGGGEEKPADPADKGKPEEGAPADGVEEDPDAELMAGMKERTRERFTEMRTNLKAAEDRIEEFQNGRGELHNVILESTATASQLSGALQIFKLINAGDAQGAASALPELKMLYNAAAQVAGATEMGGDALQNHPDLKKAVDDLDITQEKAEEMAGLRLQQAQHQQRINTADAQQGQVRQNQEYATQAAQGIKSWEDGLIANDPDFKLIQPKLIEMSREIMAKTPPNEWLPRLQHEYQSIHSGLVMANKVNQGNSPAPIRPDPAGGGGKPDTSKMSMEQLMNSSLAGMRG